MQVETKNASLDTMAVTIKTLHVSGKQMTLAVFRQLPIDCEREDSELWGVVRYSVKDEGDLWLVFSHDGTLRRRALSLRNPWVRRSDLDRVSAKLEIAEKQWPHMSEQPDSEWKSKVEQELLWLRATSKELLEAYNREYEAEVMSCEKDKRLASLTQLFIAV